MRTLLLFRVWKQTWNCAKGFDAGADGAGTRFAKYLRPKGMTHWTDWECWSRVWARATFGMPLTRLIIHLSQRMRLHPGPGKPNRLSVLRNSSSLKKFKRRRNNSKSKKGSESWNYLPKRFAKSCFMLGELYNAALVGTEGNSPLSTHDLHTMTTVSLIAQPDWLN